MSQNVKFKLIVTIVNKGQCSKVLDASREAGAEGGTILRGRGSGIHEKAKLFSLTIEPEKDLILTLVPETLSKQVLSAIVKASELDEPGHGIAFILDIDQTAGINHPVKTSVEDS
ncbi:MAG: P-II family nitrogen regulator [Balneolaceae bacterium]